MNMLAGVAKTDYHKSYLLLNKETAQCVTSNVVVKYAVLVHGQGIGSIAHHECYGEEWTDQLRRNYHAKRCRRKGHAVAVCRLSKRQTSPKPQREFNAKVREHNVGEKTVAEQHRDVI